MKYVALPICLLLCFGILSTSNASPKNTSRNELCDPSIQMKRVSRIRKLEKRVQRLESELKRLKSPPSPIVARCTGNGRDHQVISHREWVPINFPSCQFDPHRTISPKNSPKFTAFTAPFDGYYSVRGVVILQAHNSKNSPADVYLGLFIGGNLLATLSYKHVTRNYSKFISLSGSSLVKLKKGEEVSLRVYQKQTTPLGGNGTFLVASSSAHRFIDVHKL